MPTPVAPALGAGADAASDVAAGAGAEAGADDATDAATEGAGADVEGDAELCAVEVELLHAATEAATTTVDAAIRSEVRGRRLLSHEGVAVRRVLGTVTPWYAVCGQGLDVEAVASDSVDTANARHSAAAALSMASSASAITPSIWKNP